MKEAKELREPTEMYHAQPLEVSSFLFILIQVAPRNSLEQYHLRINFNNEEHYFFQLEQ